MLRLIGHAQAGREPSPAVALQEGPLPRFDGLTVAGVPIAPPPAAGLQSQTTGSGPIRIPPLTPEKVAQYSSLFERQGLQNGNMLPGDQAKQIFEKSGLPNEILGRIWMLADTEQRGALVLTEFVIAMHLLTSMKTGTLRGLPNILPAALYEAATRRGSVVGPVPRQQSPTSATPPIPAIPRQLSGQAALAQMRTGSPLGRPPLAQQSTGDWLITPPDKARFDQLYAELDKANKGFITGEEAVLFFSQSNLPEDTLAQIWDLADINSEGRLNKDTFAVAMYLIRQQRSKRDGPSILPAALPPNLIPPSLRNQARPQPVASPFDAPPPPVAQPKPSALDDLFGLDSSPSPAPPQVAVGTGGSNANDPFGSSFSPPTPSSPIRQSATGTSFKPFIPSSSFGRGLVPQATGGSNGSASPLPKSGPQPAIVEDDLLGDNDPEVSKNLSNETTELANLSNQVGSLSKQMQDVQGQRTATQNELNRASAQKKNFETRLAQLRAAYEKEAKDVRALEQQLTASRNETKKIQTELAMLDGTLQDLQNQHRQVFTALQADQQENASLKERIRAANGEIAQLKPQIEKLKSEARQQKGLVAINKKQLATNEGERDKLKLEADELTKSNEELARQISSGSPPPGQATSPALSTTTANNPFFRRTGSTDIAGAFASPPVKGFNDKSFDDVFGPSFSAGGPTTGTPPPVTSFKPQTTGTSTGSAGSFSTPGASASPNMSRQPTLNAEPPQAPDSRQLSSNYLPFAATPDPSRHVSPPASRLGQVEAVADEARTNLTASPVEAVKTGQSLGSGSGSGSGSEAAKNAASPTTENVPTSNGANSLFGAAPADEAKAKEDFESAFASFKTAQAKSPVGPSVDANKTFSSFNTEFPPISELERDDESESDSDRGGFDDDFAPASPPSKAPEKNEVTSKHSSPTLPKALPVESAPSSPDTSSTLGTERPTTRYEVMPFRRPLFCLSIDANMRHCPSDEPLPPAPAQDNAANAAGTNVDDIFGSSAALPPSNVTAPSTEPATAKVAFEDSDDDFDGLEDAKEGSADDDFANISRSGLDDFNPVFDSSPPRSQAAKSESANTNAAFGTESSFDFGSLSTTSAGGGTTVGVPSGASSGAAQPQKAPNPPDSHDWDAIFASLDDAPPASSPSPPGAATNLNGSAKESAKEPARPTAPGRALSEEGEHDDPILKNLTSMGYSRGDALLALEKCNYNLERVSFTSSSPGGFCVYYGPLANMK